MPKATNPTLPQHGLSALLSAPPSKEERAWRAARAQERQAESARFAAKHGRPLEDVVRLAARGDVGAVCQLVAWDKLWLFRDEVATVILRAEGRGDRRTLRRIGAALAKRAQPRRRSPHQRALDVLRTMRRLVDPADWDTLRTIRGRVKLMHALEGSLPESLQDDHNLYVWLRNNGLIPKGTRPRA